MENAREKLEGKLEYQYREDSIEKKTSRIEQSLEELDKSFHKLTEDLHHLFSKLEPCINKNKIEEMQQSEPKEEEEPVSPKSVIRERINLIEDSIKNTNKHINMILTSLEL